jgi:hypothetical protein
MKKGETVCSAVGAKSLQPEQNRIFKLRGSDIV